MVRLPWPLLLQFSFFSFILLNFARDYQKTLNFLFSDADCKYSSKSG